MGNKTGYNIKHKKEIKYGDASIAAMNKADNLVRAAISNPTFPQALTSTTVLSDLTNYITDHTLPSNGDLNYNQIITAWGDLLFNNDAAIKSFDFSPLKTVTKGAVINGPSDMSINMGIIKETTGNSDPAVKKANDLIKEKKPDRPATVGPGSGD